MLHVCRHIPVSACTALHRTLVGQVSHAASFQPYLAQWMETMHIQSKQRSSDIK